MPKPAKQGGIHVNVPGKPVGRAIDAFVDMFRPFSEARGLRADQIRLQREDVAIEIAKRAHERIAIENGTINPIPNKVLVPLIEAASIEDIGDDYMINMWSALLASAATNESGVEPRMIGILKELSGSQARLLHRIATYCWDEFEYPMSVLDEVTHVMHGGWNQGDLAQIFADCPDPPNKDDLHDVLHAVFEHFHRPGCAIHDIILTHNGEVFSGCIPNNEFADPGLDIDTHILESLGLCSNVNQEYFPKGTHDVRVVYTSITRLGYRLLEHCCPELFTAKQKTKRKKT